MKSRFSAVDDKNNKGIIKFEDYNIESSKIILSVIEYKNQLETEIVKKANELKNSDVELELLIYTNAYAKHN